MQDMPTTNSITSNLVVNDRKSVYKIRWSKEIGKKTNNNDDDHTIAITGFGRRRICT
jgi:hypothetical protein